MKKIIALILALCMVFVLCACGKSAETVEEASSDKLIAGTSADYPPYEFMYKDDSGEMVYGGLDVEVVKFIAEDMGKEPQIENMAFDYLLTALQKGDYDIVIAAIEAVGDRLDAADWSDPYYQPVGDAPALIVVLKENADKYQSLEDFAGVTIGAQATTTKADLVTECIPDANLQTLTNVNDLINELVNNKLDAVILDTEVAQSFVASNSSLASLDEVSALLGEAEPYCIAVQKGDPKGLLPEINAAIAKITEEQKAEWFNAANELDGAGLAESVSVDAPAE